LSSKRSTNPPETILNIRPSLGRVSPMFSVPARYFEAYPANFSRRVDSAPLAFCRKGLEERKLDISTTTNNTLEPHTSTSLRASRAPDLHTSTSKQRISRTLEANPYTSLHPQHASRSLASTRLQHISRAPYLDVPSLAVHLQTSRALEATSYTYLHRLPTSEPPYLHVCTPTAHLPSSRSLEANTSTSLRRQCASRVPGLLREMRQHACSAPPDLF